MVTADWTPMQLWETEGESLVGWKFLEGKKYMAEECANLLNPTQPLMVAEVAVLWFGGTSGLTFTQGRCVPSTSSWVVTSPMER